MSKISDLIPDNKNYNIGNEFGNSLIEKSLRNLGAGRSILIDKNNRIIAGNKTVENAVAIGLEDMQIVESDGTKIIAVKRTDIDLDSKKGRELALADNASAKANIVWNHENLKEDWGDDELKGWGLNDVAMLGKVNNLDSEYYGDDLPAFEVADKDIQLTIVFPTELDRQQYCDANGIKPTSVNAGQWTLRL